jgi:hypothetical protein
MARNHTRVVPAGKGCRPHIYWCCGHRAAPEAKREAPRSIFCRGSIDVHIQLSPALMARRGRCKMPFAMRRAGARGRRRRRTKLLTAQHGGNNFLSRRNTRVTENGGSEICPTLHRARPESRGCKKSDGVDTAARAQTSLRRTHAPASEQSQARNQQRSAV